MSLCPRTQTVPRAGRVPPTPASLAKSDVTTGRVPCLNQSNDFASLDLSVLFFFILPVNTSASTGPPNRTWRAFVLRCFAKQPCKEQTPDNTKGSPPPRPPVPELSFSMVPKLYYELGMLATQTVQSLTEFSQIYLIENSCLA